MNEAVQIFEDEPGLIAPQVLPILQMLCYAYVYLVVKLLVVILLGYILALLLIEIQNRRNKLGNSAQSIGKIERNENYGFNTAEIDEFGRKNENVDQKTRRHYQTILY